MGERGAVFYVTYTLSGDSGFGFVRLRELNLRTYVRFRGQPGIYFFTLDTDNLLGQWIGRKFFHLPYRLRRLQGSVRNKDYLFKSADSLQLRAQIGEPCVSGSLDRWLVERYSLFTRGKDAFFVVMCCTSLGS